MKAVLLVLLILAAGAGAWYSGLSGMFGYNGQYQDFQEWIATRKALDKEIRIWTVERDQMVKWRGEAEEENGVLLADKASMTRQRDEQQAKNDDLKSEESQLTAELESIAAKEKELRDQLAAILEKYSIDNWEALPAMVEAREANNKKLQEEIDEILAAIEVATKKRNDQQTELNNRQKEQADYRALLTKNGDEFSVLSVDPEWGFVVIGAGQENSSIDNSTVLLVTRNGRSIGKLKVSSLEKTQTVADVVDGSVPEGMSIQPGDTVQLLSPHQSLK